MLSSYSTQTLSVLLTAFPHFRNCVNVQEDYFSIEVNSPSGLPFIISSENDELTVYFSEHHCHFTSFDEQGSVGGYPADDAGNAVNYIQKLISGEVALAVWIKNGSVSLSYSFNKQEGHVPTNFNWLSEWMWKRRMRNATLVVKQWSS